MLHTLAEVGILAEWFLMFIAAAVGVLVVVCVVAAFVTIFTKGPRQQEICYEIFLALLRFFRRGRDGRAPAARPGRAAGDQKVVILTSCSETPRPAP